MKRLDSKSASTLNPERASYSAPILSAYGSLKDRTKGGDYFGNDGNQECTGNANAGNNLECGVS